MTDQSTTPTTPETVNEVAQDMLQALKDIQDLLGDWPTMRALSAYGAEKATGRKQAAKEIVSAAIEKAERVLANLPSEDAETTPPTPGR